MNFEKVKEIIVDTLSCDDSEVVLEASLTEDLEADSLDIMELSMAIEEAYGITIDQDIIPDLKTVKDIVDYLDKNAE